MKGEEEGARGVARLNQMLYGDYLAEGILREVCEKICLRTSVGGSWYDKALLHLAIKNLIKNAYNGIPPADGTLPSDEQTVKQAVWLMSYSQIKRIIYYTSRHLYEIDFQRFLDEAVGLERLCSRVKE